MVDEIEIDARGYKCPVPSLKLRKAMEMHVDKRRFVLWATDPMARIDVPFLMQERGGRVISIEDVDGALRLVVESPAI